MYHMRGSIGGGLTALNSGFLNNFGPKLARPEFNVGPSSFKCRFAGVDNGIWILPPLIIKQQQQKKKKKKKKKVADPLTKLSGPAHVTQCKKAGNI